MGSRDDTAQAVGAGLGIAGWLSAVVGMGMGLLGMNGGLGLGGMRRF